MYIYTNITYKYFNQLRVHLHKFNLRYYTWLDTAERETYTLSLLPKDSGRIDCIPWFLTEISEDAVDYVDILVRDELYTKVTLKEFIHELNKL